MIEDKDFQAAAVLLGCEVAAIRAVDEVESGGAGFMKNGKIQIKFEGHIFRRYTDGKYDSAYPDLSYKSWTEKFTKYGNASYERFNRAFRLDPHAAMMATSWGRYQIMGFNYSSCGFKDVEAFVSYLHDNEGNHLIAFCRYVKAQGLAKYLAAKNWAAFAYRYNGADYKKNDYDILLQHNYQLHSAAKITPTQKPL